VRFFYPNKPTRVYTPDRVIPRLTNPAQWVVQPKWDGKRAEISCEAGKVMLRSREGREWPDQRWGWLARLPLPQPWFLDGELTRDNYLHVWDYAVLGGELKFREPYQDRLERLQELLPKLLVQENQTLVPIETRPATEYEEVLKREGDPHLEGVVWKNLQGTDFWGPWSTNTISSQLKFRFNP
jgi:ATP-dependent DNA ligase